VGDFRWPWATCGRHDGRLKTRPDLWMGELGDLSGPIERAISLKAHAATLLKTMGLYYAQESPKSPTYGHSRRPADSLRGRLGVLHSPGCRPVRATKDALGTRPGAASECLQSLMRALRPPRPPLVGSLPQALRAASGRLNRCAGASDRRPCPFCARLRRAATLATFRRAARSRTCERARGARTHQ
jgi:hypothetical protein